MTAMLMGVGLAGLVPLGFAAFRLGKDGDLKSTPVIVAGAVGLAASLTLGVLPLLLVGIGFLLIGRGMGVQGGSRVVLVLLGSGLLALPFLFGALMYMASLAA